jgi:hypothetical protein
VRCRRQVKDVKQRYRKHVRAVLEGVIYLLLAVTVVMAVLNKRRKAHDRQVQAGGGGGGGGDLEYDI